MKLNKHEITTVIAALRLLKELGIDGTNTYAVPP
jgi:hypothetical protein